MTKPNGGIGLEYEFRECNFCNFSGEEDEYGTHCKMCGGGGSFKIYQLYDDKATRIKELAEQINGFYGPMGGLDARAQEILDILKGEK